MGTDFSGIAAATELDALLSHDDFEPVTDVDVDLLDATIDALAAATALVARLTGLQAHLAAGGTADVAEGLAVDVAVATETVAAIVAARIA